MARRQHGVVVASDSPQQTIPRAVSAASLVVTIALGLLSRAVPLPGVFAEHTGDALYAVAVGWLLLAIGPTMRPRRAGLAAFSVAAAVEFSQLAKWDWLVHLRATRVGALLLGQGFQAADLLAYGIGGCLLWATAKWLTRPARR